MTILDGYIGVECQSCHRIVKHAISRFVLERGGEGFTLCHKCIRKIKGMKL